MHNCIGKPSMYPTYFIICLTIRSLKDNTSQCNQPVSSPSKCRPQHQSLQTTRIHMCIFRFILIIFKFIYSRFMIVSTKTFISNSQKIQGATRYWRHRQYLLGIKVEMRTRASRILAALQILSGMKVEICMRSLPDISGTTNTPRV